MKIACIGSRGFPASYASAEDMVREFGPRFVRDGHEFTVHCWETDESRAKGIKEDTHKGLKRVFHSTPGGKISGQFFVALKSSLHAAKSDCDVVFYIFVNSAIFSWIPRLAGKKIFVNIDGIMWKDPKWPWGLRQIFFPAAAYLSIAIGKAITDSYHMQQLYRKYFHVKIDWVGYGCSENPPQRKHIEFAEAIPYGYYLIMSRITPHNLTDLMVDGFVASKTKAHLFVAGHTPDTPWFHDIKKRVEGKNVSFLGLVRDQEFLNQLILNAKAYLHGHSLGGINPALVRVTGMDTPAICVDTVFNREVVEYPNKQLQACMFTKDIESVSASIREFENREEHYRSQAKSLGITIRRTMSWENIYQEYKNHLLKLT
jgi:glycosyltransferase involved in cell wall biosynthesis